MTPAFNEAAACSRGSPGIGGLEACGSGPSMRPRHVAADHFAQKMKPQLHPILQ